MAMLMHQLEHKTPFFCHNFKASVFPFLGKNIKIIDITSINNGQANKSIQCKQPLR